MKINVKDFSMTEFLAWLGENKESIQHFELKQVGELGLLRAQMVNKNIKTLSQCGNMGVKEAHLKACELFDIDTERKICNMKIEIDYDSVPRITTTELKI
jgi:hypothetical protein